MFDGLFSPVHILIVLVVALLVLGPKQLPRVARGLGRGLGELRRMMGTVRDEARSLLDDDEDDAAAPAPATPEVTPNGVSPNGHGRSESR